MTRDTATEDVAAGKPLGVWRRSPGLIVAVAGLAFFAFSALTPTVLATRDPFAIDISSALQPPSLSHLLGTDASGRDLYSRIVYGTRESLLIGIGATAIAISIAIVLGFAAGLGNRTVDAILARSIDVLFAFPILLMALLLVSAYGAGAGTLVVAVGIGTAPGYARMIRGQVLSVRSAGYVEAAKALGHSRWAVLRRHIFPNAMRPLVVTTTLGVGHSIVWASGLAFLGLGVAPPSPEWGALLDAGRAHVTRAWWLEVFPGLAIVLLALALTTAARHLQNRMEGRES
ncbi:peptide ABC transporter permease [Rhodococcus sp. 06-621-2]|nr:ABC transporter permease [Rhodococcus sp. 06-621-2]OZC55523.1 peptide ABC transporter permease [Rhodococcus sp. 06-621-2]